MNGWLSKVGAVALGLCFSLPAFAGERQREVRQQDRIEQGVRSGQLTRREAARLEQREMKLREQARRDRLRHNGRLTRREQARLAQRQNRLSRRIHAERHDAQRRF